MSAGDGMCKMASSLLCLVHRLGWLEELELDGDLSLFFMHPLPWLTWAFSQHDNLWVSLIRWLTFPGANVSKRHEDEEAVSQSFNA